MKVDIKQDPGGEALFVEIHCRELTKEVARLERYIRRFGAFVPARENGESVQVDADSILYMESVDKKTFIYTDDRVLLTEKRLYELEEMLDRGDFFRCSKSVILHLNKVVRLKPELNRNILVTLSNGERIVVSRRYAAALKELLGIGG